MRTLTERLAKRLRRGQPIPAQSVSDETILRWAMQYATTRIEPAPAVSGIPLIRSNR